MIDQVDILRDSSMVNQLYTMYRFDLLSKEGEVERGQ